MQVKIDWQDPIQLTKYRKIIVQKKPLLEIVDKRPGLYFFSRRFGDAFEPFYIGRTKSIRGRLRHHWGAAKIQDVLRGIVNDEVTDIKNGDRFFHYGYLSNKVSDFEKYLVIGERYLIRVAVERGYTLLNSSLTKIRTHKIDFNGTKSARAIYPKTGEIEVQRTRSSKRLRLLAPPT